MSLNNVSGDEAFNEGLDILEQNNLEYAGESPRMYLTEDDFGYRLFELAGTVINIFKIQGRCLNTC